MAEGTLFLAHSPRPDVVVLLLPRPALRGPAGHRGAGLDNLADREVEPVLRQRDRQRVSDRGRCRVGYEEHAGAVGQQACVKVGAVVWNRGVENGRPALLP